LTLIDLKNSFISQVHDMPILWLTLWWDKYCLIWYIICQLLKFFKLCVSKLTPFLLLCNRYHTSSTRCRGSNLAWVVSVWSTIPGVPNQVDSCIRWRGEDGEAWMLGTPSLDRGYSPTCFRSLVLGYSITIRSAFYNDKSKIKNII